MKNMFKSQLWWIPTIIIWIIIIILLSSCTSGKKESIVATPKIGDTFQGGVVIYILQPNDLGYKDGETHGFVAHPSEYANITWGCLNAPTSQFSTLLGYGDHNTNIITSYCNKPNAAYLCDTLTTNGYKDWYLPNPEELKKALVLKDFGSKTDYYWTSYKIDYSNGAALRPLKLDISNFNVNSLFKVKPIRKF